MAHTHTSTRARTHTHTHTHTHSHTHTQTNTHTHTHARTLARRRLIESVLRLREYGAHAHERQIYVCLGGQKGTT